MITSADILEITKTKDEANRLQIEIDRILTMLFSNKSFDDILIDEITYERKEKLLSLLQKYHVDIHNVSQLQKFFQDIKIALQQMPVITLTLAFSPKQQLTTTLSSWISVHIKKNILLDIRVDRQLLGGTIITYNGIYKDNSLKKLLEEKYTKREIQITK